jgi:biotin-dependent carboxylase-like uncharacterized protein
VSAGLRVLHAGHTTFQDLGRFGAESIGLSVNGAPDQLSAQVANILVGNPRGATHLELTALRAEFRAEAPLLVAVAGAKCTITVDGVRRPHSSPIPLLSGQRLALDRIRHGVRVSLAVNGALATPLLAGSAAPDPIVGFGQRLADGDLVEVKTRHVDFRHPEFDLPVFRFWPPSAHSGTPGELRITVGTETNELQAPDTLTSSVFAVSSVSDYVGLRLVGPHIGRQTQHELVSRGVPVGAVELLPSGELIVLNRGRFVTAGYPIVAVVTRSSQPLLGQATPGDEIRFRWESRQESVAAHRREVAALNRFELLVGEAFRASGLLHGHPDYLRTTAPFGVRASPDQ